MVEVKLRLTNERTGEIRDLNTYKGSIFDFVVDYVEENDHEGEWILLTDDIVDIMISKGTQKMKRRGYYWDDLVDVYGMEGFLKEITNRQFYVQFGWFMEMMVEW